MHPACLPIDDLLAECDQKAARRTGPGGQHRNKVETAVILTHRPSGIQAEASERRSQAENRAVAIQRLRTKLALEFRAPRAEEAQPSALWQARCRQGRVAVAVDHADYPSLLAELFDYLAANDFEMSVAASHFHATASQLTKLLRKCPAALQKLNAQRNSLGLSKLV